MENLLLNKLKMYNSVRTVIDAQSPVWAASVSFKTQLDHFAAYMDRIEEKIHAQKSSKSDSKEKLQMKNRMLDLALIVSAAGTAYAGMVKDHKLKEKFKHSKTSLKEGNEEEVFHRCQNISEEAIALEAQLSDYNIKPEQLNEFNAAVISFHQLQNKPRDVRKAGKSAKEEMIALFEQCDYLLYEMLDKQMLTYKESHPDFYLEYTNARHIGGRSKKKAEEILPTV